MVMKLRNYTIFGCLAVFLTASVQPTHAVELQITGNGNGDNTIETTVETSKSINQTNQSSANTSINTSATTGQNSANNNTGNETTIDTGSVTETVTVANNLNSSTINSECCENDDASTITIQGNTNDNNTVSSETEKTTTVLIENTAVINTQISGSANTGKNTAKNNTGAVTIKTGAINARDSITTIANTTTISAPANGPGSYTIVIHNNANGSTTVLLNDHDELAITSINNAQIQNSTLWDLSTGGNFANNNTGPVSILTGSIGYSSDITNIANANDVTLSCCKKEITPTPDPVIDPPYESPKELPKPTKSSDGNGNGSSVGSGSSSVGVGGASATAGAILPATGMSWWLYATIANITMLLMGLYLRLKAGRSPARE